MLFTVGFVNITNHLAPQKRRGHNHIFAPQFEDIHHHDHTGNGRQPQEIPRIEHSHNVVAFSKKISAFGIAAFLVLVRSGGGSFALRYWKLSARPFAMPNQTKYRIAYWYRAAA